MDGANSGWASMPRLSPVIVSVNNFRSQPRTTAGVSRVSRSYTPCLRFPPDRVKTGSTGPAGGAAAGLTAAMMCVDAESTPLGFRSPCSSTLTGFPVVCAFAADAVSRLRNTRRSMLTMLTYSFTCGANTRQTEALWPTLQRAAGNFSSPLHRQESCAARDARRGTSESSRSSLFRRPAQKRGHKCSSPTLEELAGFENDVTIPETPLAGSAGNSADQYES